MFKSKIESLYRKKVNARLCQGDIFEDLKFVIGDPELTTPKKIFSLTHAVILSQDCDLLADFNFREENKSQDKFLLSLLVSPAFILGSFAQGKHIGNWAMKVFNAGEMDKIKNNDSFKRYHYLKAEPSFSIPELVIDFKQSFSLPRDFLYNAKGNKYIASLNEIFREALSQRFSNYLSRIGLPELPEE